MLKANHPELLILNLELDKVQTHKVQIHRDFLTVHHVDVTMRISRRQVTAIILRALNILEPASLANMMKVEAYYEFRKPPYFCVLSNGLVY